MDSDPSEGATADIFADMFSGDGAATSVHEQDVSANPADSDNWVESLYQTIMDPTLASKSVTLLTESPINVATSSPTISQPSSPAPERRIGDCVGGESGPQIREEVEEEDEDEETINARNRGISGPGVAEKRAESAGTDHVTAFQPFALPTLEFLRDSLAKYTELLSKKEPMDSIPARTDFLVTHYCELHGLRLRPKAINECLAQIRRDKETAQLSARIGNKELLDEIRNLLVLSDKKRKAYNKKKSQRHQQQAEMHTSTPVKAAMVGGDGRCDWCRDVHGGLWSHVCRPHCNILCWQSGQSRRKSRRQPCRQLCIRSSLHCPSFGFAIIHFFVYAHPYTSTARPADLDRPQHPNRVLPGRRVEFRRRCRLRPPLAGRVP